MDWQNLIATRDSLVSRLKNLDDQESWHDFFNTYWRLIHNVALKVGLSESEAQDVVQATVITVAKNIHTFQKRSERGSFKAWLLNTTRWRIADQFRKRRPGDSVEPGANEETSRTPLIDRIPDPASAELDAVWDKEWERNLLDVAIEAVKRRVEPSVYQLFDLNAVQHWPAQKIAQTLGVTIHQVYSAKYKVSELIKKEVERLKQKPVG
jgi:RNA polymerase sigma-70 factor (ECF subfamily)